MEAISGLIGSIWEAKEREPYEYKQTWHPILMQSETLGKTNKTSAVNWHYETESDGNPERAHST